MTQVKRQCERKFVFAASRCSYIYTEPNVNNTPKAFANSSPRDNPGVHKKIAQYAEGAR